MLGPSTKALLEYLQADGQAPESEMPATPDDGYQVQGLTMQMKRKRYQMMLRQMLKDAGYGDLANMTSIGRDRYDVGGPEEE